MNIEPLNHQKLIEYNDYLKTSNANIEIIDEFFYQLIKLIDTNIDYNEDIKELLEDMDFRSIDEANIFIGKYTEFTNSIVSFIDNLETITKDNPKDEIISEIYNAICEIYKDDLKTIASLIVSNSLQIIKFIFDTYNITLEEDDKNSEKFKSDIDTHIGENYSMLFIAILSLVDTIESDPNNLDNHTVSSLFTFIILLIVNMNIKRKDEFIEHKIFDNTFQKTGRNEPCPCGSGLKYKKCCFQKLH